MSDFSISPDWYKVSFLGDDAVARAVALFGGDMGFEFTSGDRGLWGYRKSESRGYVMIHHSNPSPMMHGYCTVDVSGQGCRQLEREGVVESWSTFTKAILDAGGSFTRLDVAFDVKNGFTWEQLRQAVTDGHVVTRMDKVSSVQTIASDGKTVLSESLYYGSPKSDTRLAFYNKRAEQLLVHERFEGGLPDSWVRMEMRSFKKRAHAMAECIAKSDDLTPVWQHFVAMWDLRCPGASVDRTVTRWGRVPFWAEFVGSIEGCRITIDRSEDARVNRLERAKNWFRSSVAPTVAVLVAAHGWAWLTEQVQHRAQYLKERLDNGVVHPLITALQSHRAALLAEKSYLRSTSGLILLPAPKDISFDAFAAA